MSSKSGITSPGPRSAPKAQGSFQRLGPDRYPRRSEQSVLWLRQLDLGNARLRGFHGRRGRGRIFVPTRILPLPSRWNAIRVSSCNQQQYLGTGFLRRGFDHRLDRKQLSHFLHAQSESVLYASGFGGRNLGGIARPLASFHSPAERARSTCIQAPQRRPATRLTPREPNRRNIGTGSLS